jgi:hypothetical protein
MIAADVNLQDRAGDLASLARMAGHARPLGLAAAAAVLGLAACGSARPAAPAVLADCATSISQPANPFASCQVSTVTGKVYVHRVTVLASFPTGGTQAVTLSVNRTIGERAVTVTVPAPVRDGYAPGGYQVQSWS